ncbi:MAG TPA: DUF3127 domain-containing protein [Bacteroidales bacterium]|nr:DUF3127 domain-containing protein [Bacteroidales bacterium]
MSLEIEGTLVKVLPEKSGEGKNGRWLKQDFIIETNDKFPKQVCISLWNDKAKMLENFKEGDTVNASINIESREFREKWYTDVKAWKLEASGSGSPSPAGPDIPMPGDEAPSAPMNDAPPPPQDDDLPF